MLRQRYDLIRRAMHRWLHRIVLGRPEPTFLQAFSIRVTVAELEADLNFGRD